MAEERGIEMDEYIKKETAYRAIMGERPEAREPSWFAEMILDIPVVDAVEVVRCRDCRHWNEETGFCNLNSHFSMDGLDWDVFNDDDFCSQGERKQMTEHMEVRTNE